MTLFIERFGYIFTDQMIWLTIWLTRHNDILWFFNSSSPIQNGRHFADSIFRCIFVNEKFYILSKISLKFVLKGPIDNKPALVQVMAWCQTGDKPLPEPMLTQYIDAFMRQKG